MFVAALRNSQEGEQPQELSIEEGTASRVDSDVPWYSRPLPLWPRTPASSAATPQVPGSRDRVVGTCAGHSSRLARTPAAVPASKPPRRALCAPAARWLLARRRRGDLIFTTSCQPSSSNGAWRPGVDTKQNEAGILQTPSGTNRFPSPEWGAEP